jgi:2'-5' RNA ligase
MPSRVSGEGTGRGGGAPRQRKKVKTMRLFTAIELNEDARQAIAAEQKRIAGVLGRDTESSLTWIRPEHMHLTLVFLGEVEQAHTPAVIDAMGEDLENAEPFPMVFAGLGLFPAHGAPRVLWLGVSTGATEAIELRRRVAERLSPTGVTIEERAFHPHLTLARWRKTRHADRRRLAAADRGAEVARVEVGAVTLYQSRLSSSGPTYTMLARAPLVGGVRL